MGLVRRWLTRLHLWVGLSAGTLLVVAGLTGSVLVFRGEIDRWLQPELTRVEVAGSRLPLDSAVAAARAARPDAAPSYIRLPTSRTEPITIWTDGEAGPRIRVDPYRGTVLGSTMPDETFTGFLFDLHVNLLSGETGEIVMGITALALVFLSITGLVIGWPKRGRMLEALRIRWRRNWRRVNYDVHRAGGNWTLLFLLVIAVTGASLVFHEAFQAGLNRVTGSEPPVAPPPSSPHPGATDVALEPALRTANRALPGGRATWVYLPASPEAPLAVRMRLEGELHPNGTSYVYLDRYSGGVLHVRNALAAPIGTRIYDLLYPLHIGRFGFVGKLLYAVLGLAPVVLFVTGLIYWWKRRRLPSRRPTKGRGPLKRPAARLPDRDRGRRRRIQR